MYNLKKTINNLKLSLSLILPGGMEFIKETPLISFIDDCMLISFFGHTLSSAKPFMFISFAEGSSTDLLSTAANKFPKVPSIIIKTPIMTVTLKKCIFNKN